MTEKDYTLLAKQAKAMISGVLYPTANLANLSALLYQALEEINWAGFYLMRGQRLILGPFQGLPACVEIPLGKGVCGTAAARDETVIVKNVHEFPGHIACDSASLSEIVIPMHAGGTVMGVLDIDSPAEGRFTETDAKGLGEIVRIFEEEMAALLKRPLDELFGGG